MALTVLLCTDGSELALNALAAGMEVLGAADRVVIATVVEPVDPTLLTGTGMAAGVDVAAGLRRGWRATATRTLGRCSRRHGRRSVSVTPSCSSSPARPATACASSPRSSPRRSS